jgi:hypothetical protein
MWLVTTSAGLFHDYLLSIIGLNHGTNIYPITTQGCDVLFDILLPQDLQACPYYLFTSIGEHKHPPPPPVKTPLDILGEIREIIRDMQNPDLRIGQ